MSEKSSRKKFLVATGTVVAGWLAACGLRRNSGGVPVAVAGGEDALPVVRRESRAVPMRRA